MIRLRRRLLLGALAVAWTAAVCGASEYQPRLAFRVLATPHFRIYHHAGEEPVARRLAPIAEAVRADLAARTGLPAPGLTHVVLANQDDLANGSATPFPYRTIRLAIGWPSGADLVANTDDWLRIVFVHEYTHILQFELGGGWAVAARRVLGRSPIAFPNIFLPQWQIEGYATYWESRLTAGGRLASGDAVAIVRERARAAVEPIDRANGGLVDWPGGQAAYLDGALFYGDLASRFGESAVGTLQTASAARLPYLSAPVFRRLFGQSLGTLWREWQGRLASAGSPAAQRVERLTRRGFEVSSPRFTNGGRTLVFSANDPDEFPGVYELPAVGGAATRRATQFGGTRVSAAGLRLFFDRIDLTDNVAWRSDIYVADGESGAVQRLSTDRRLIEPDVTADGKALACVRVEDDGRRALAIFDVEQGPDGRLGLSPRRSPGIAEAVASYGNPRWSPDATRLAAERRLLNGPSEIVVIDMATGTERVLAWSPSGRSVTPSWTPDGGTLLFSSDRAGGDFAIYAVAVGGGGVRLVSSVAGGAMYPEMAPDGARIVFVGLGPGGHDLCATEVDRASWGPAPPPAAPREPAAAVAEVSPSRVVPYSPLPTLAPRAWTPRFDTADGGLRLGAGVAGVDVLDRHHYAASALWRTGRAAGVSAPGRPDWSASYVYDRWRPALFVSAAESTSVLEVRTGDGGSRLADIRDRDLSAGVQVPLTKVRHAQVWEVAFNAGAETLGFESALSERRRNALRLAWAASTAQRYGRSISPEDGLSVAVTSEQVRAALGADGDADAFTGEVRGYVRPGRGHGVLAVRAGYGAASGDAAVRRRFYLGGSMPAGPLIDFGSNALRMLRGFDDSVTAGDHVAVATLEWRQPLLAVQRGWGTVPLFVRTLHAAAFVDAGETWVARFSASAVRTALGAEASCDVVAGFGLPLTVSAGAAWTRDGAGAGRSRASLYLRLGSSF